MSDQLFSEEVPLNDLDDTELLPAPEEFRPQAASTAKSDASPEARREELIRQTLLRLGPAVVRPSSIFALMDVNPRDTEQVLAVIKRSPGLAARILSVINSAAFGMTRQVTSIDRAVHLLGATRARAIALAYGLRVLTDRSGLPNDLADLLWANSLQKAVAARRFCLAVDEQFAESAYSLGLIQDIGLAMLMSVDVDFYRQHMRHGPLNESWCAIERERFGFDHASIGQGLLNEWSASRQVQDAILNHHRPPTDKLNKQSSTLDLSVFFASLLPHLEEEPGAEQMEWLQAIHARFLSRTYTTPEQFMRAVFQDVRQLRDQEAQIAANEALMRKLVNQVTASTIAITAKLCKLEQDIDQQRQGITDLKFQAFTDPLTKVLNRRGFTQLAERRLDLAAEQQLGVCVMLGDLDDFKKINDTHGHDVGDLVLRGLARVMRHHISRNDLIGRLGGDEFAILVTDVNQQHAMETARAVCDAIEGKKLRVRDDLHIEAHFSLGAIFCPGTNDPYSIDNLLNLADQAMYDRKRNGKHGLTFTATCCSAADSGNPRPITRRNIRTEQTR